MVKLLHKDYYLHKDINSDLTECYFATYLVVIPRAEKALWSE